MYYLLMKTLIRPQAKLTIAISRDHFYKQKINSNYRNVKSFQTQFVFIPVLLSVFVLLLVPESPHKISKICTRNYSEQICNIL